MFRRKQDKPYLPLLIPHAHGLKCDTPGCDHTEPDVNMASYIDWIDAPCPKCGASLLTPADYLVLGKQIAAAKRLNDWANRWLPLWLLRRLTPVGKRRYYAQYMRTNGTGRIERGKTEVIDNAAS